MVFGDWDLQVEKHCFKVSSATELYIQWLEAFFQAEVLLPINVSFTFFTHLVWDYSVMLWDHPQPSTITSFFPV